MARSEEGSEKRYQCHSAHNRIHQPQLTSTGLRSSEHNKQMHIKYDNIKKFINIAQCNKVNSYIVNTIDRLK